MWNLAKTYAIVTVCLVVATAASAQYPSQPFVGMTVTQEPIDLGDVIGPGVHQIRSQATVHVVANCPYHIEASFQGLRNGSGGKAISPQHLTVAINGKEMPVGTGRITIAQSSRPTASAGEDIPVDLQVGFLGLPIYPAGRYHGALMLTVMVGP
jgi:hypothetical protein